MKDEFTFATRAPESVRFCRSILDEMTRIHGIPREEALRRVNHHWSGADFVDDDLRFHELPEFWAEDIYYGSDSYWWNRPPGLRPRVLPTNPSGGGR